MLQIAMYILIVDPVYCFRRHLATIFNPISLRQNGFSCKINRLLSIVQLLFVEPQLESLCAMYSLVLLAPVLASRLSCLCTIAKWFIR